ncbi:thyrotropin-releasing hormone receptor-like [Amphiura filiformis]|uniref:thyrotropin-releasing hormone receptor-like n=1 Tax=Amphiura filiformis TaxID=82378 RepID=UPI003B21DFFA
MNSSLSNDVCDFLLSEKEATLYLYTIYKKIFILIIVPIVSGLGILGNAALLFVVYRVQEMRTVTNFYLSNLAVSDAILLVVGGVKYMWAYFTTPIDFAPSAFHSGIGCALVGLITYLCYFTSVFLITLVTFERYLAICHPLSHRMLKGRSWTVKMTLGIWLMSLVSACVSLDIHETETICIDWSNNSTIQNGATSFSVCKADTNCSWCWQALAAIDFAQFVLAVILSSYMYGRIIYELSTRSGLTSERGSEKQTAAMLRARNQITRMLILNGIVFFVCLAPFELVNIDHFKNWLVGERIYSAETKKFILWLGRVAMLLNSAVNPLLYNVSNERYRRAFAEAFGCVGKCKRSSYSTDGSGNAMKSASQVANTESTSTFNKTINM